MIRKSFEHTTYVKWQQWFDIIYKEIQELLVYRNVFMEVKNIIKANPKIQESSSFYDFLDIAYIAFATMSVRRQIKNDKDSISFARLLSEMQRHPKIMSKERFAAMYKMSSDEGRGVPALRKHLENRVQKAFRKYSDESRNYFNPKIADRDLQYLRMTVKKIEDFADRRIAHCDKRSRKTLASYKNLDDSIDFLENLVRKYYLLFHADALISVLPFYQYDWKQIFKHPWIEHKESDLMEEEVGVVEILKGGDKNASR
ncbi:MAG: hypothetical protein PHG97_02920 [Candidatus Margulisbacteria bacterium]|nr:hypothetical protein [Candidatus Margulisiibacteriota bacterium]